MSDFLLMYCCCCRCLINNITFTETEREIDRRRQRERGRQSTLQGVKKKEKLNVALKKITNKQKTATNSTTRLLKTVGEAVGGSGGGTAHTHTRTHAIQSSYNRQVVVSFRFVSLRAASLCD